MQPFILIAGCPRSGTTLIRNILDAHPDVFIFPQTQYFNKIWGSRRLTGFKKNRRKMLSIISQDRAVVRAGMDLFTKPNLSRHTFDDYYDEYVKLIEENNHLQKKIVGDKTPRHIFFLHKIKKHIPRHLKTIVVVRDSRAVVASQIKRGIVRSIEHGAATWNSFLNRITTLQKTLPKEDIMMIRYEDLISDPEKIVRKLTNYLNIDYSERMLNIRESNSSYTNKPQKGIYNDSLFQWQEELSGDETHIISQLTKKYLAYFEYDISATGNSVSLRSKFNYTFYRMTEHAIISLMNFGLYPTYRLEKLKQVLGKLN